MKKFTILLSLILFVLSSATYAGGCDKLKAMGDTYNTLANNYRLQVDIFNDNILKVRNKIQPLYTRVDKHDDVKAAYELDNFLDGFIDKLRKELEAVEETYIDLDLLVFDRDEIEGECSAKADTLTDDYIQPTADEIITLVIKYEDLIEDLERVNAYNKNYLGR